MTASSYNHVGEISALHEAIAMKPSIPPLLSAGTTGMIRAAEFNDVPAILAISNHYALNSSANFAIAPETLESWQERWVATHERYPWLVACDDRGATCGFAKSSPWKARCAYQWTAEVSVYLSPDCRGRGIGRALYERLFAILTAQGYHSAIGGITLPNPASVRLHEFFGMKHVGTFTENGWKRGRWHDVGYWMKVLNKSDGEPAPPRPVCEVLAEFPVRSA